VSVATAQIEVDEFRLATHIATTGWAATPAVGRRSVGTMIEGDFVLPHAWPMVDACFALPRGRATIEHPDAT
jgi:hypothetical protein